MSSSPNYKLIEFEYNPDAIFDILYKDENILVNKTKVSVAAEQDVQAIRDLLNLQNIHHIIYFSMPPNGFSSIHLDGTKKENIYNSLATNLPLVNSNKVKMSWFDSLVDDEIVNKDVYPQVPVLTNDQAKYIESIYYTQPVSVEILKWHNVINESNQHAHFCSLRFFK